MLKGYQTKSRPTGAQLFMSPLPSLVPSTQVPILISELGLRKVESPASCTGLVEEERFVS